MRQSRLPRVDSHAGADIGCLIEPMEQRMFLSGHAHDFGRHPQEFSGSPTWTSGMVSITYDYSTNFGNLLVRFANDFVGVAPFFEPPAGKFIFGQTVGTTGGTTVGTTGGADESARPEARGDIRHDRGRDSRRDADDNSGYAWNRPELQRSIRSVRSDADQSDGGSPAAAAVALAVAAPSAAVSAAARAVNSAVVRSLFAVEQTIAEAPQVRVAPRVNLVAAPLPALVAQNAAPARTLAAYLSVLTDNAAPVFVNANGAAAQVLAGAGAAAESAIAAAVQSLPIAQRFEIARFGPPFLLLGDSIGNFIQESAAITGVAAADEIIAHPYRAWTVTFAVITADVVLLTYYHQRRRKLEVATRA